MGHESKIRLKIQQGQMYDKKTTLISLNTPFLFDKMNNLEVCAWFDVVKNDVERLMVIIISTGAYRPCTDLELMNIYSLHELRIRICLEGHELLAYIKK